MRSTRAVHSIMNVGPITTIRELVRELLRHRDPTAYGEILARYAVPSRDLEPYFRWNTRHYTRTCINRNEDFELLVICYEPGQRTSIHDYDSQTAWIHPVIGEVVEVRYTTLPGDVLKLTSEIHLHPGTVDSLTNGKSIHRFVNLGPERAVTLNLYAKPMSKWRVYDEVTGTPSVAPAGPPR
ncbi:MAG: cysteine dioxygenase family protein [Flavobacteriales bacterium]|nr:cysteine dioxygenase family protein [Flavobacteriales bacterium]